VYGAGGFGRGLSTVLEEYKVKVIAFIDASQTGTVSEFEILAPEAADKNIPVVIGVCNLYGDLQQIYSTLQTLGFSELYSPVEVFSLLSVQGYKREHYWLTTDFELYQREEKSINQFKNLLSDDLSKSLYDSILEYRVSGDVEKLPQVLGIEQQYLPTDIPVVPRPMKLLDCGAYVGEIIEYSRNLNFEIESIYAFEPDPLNYSKLADCVSASNLTGQALAYQMGVGERTEQLRFSADGNLGAAISEDGDVVIQVVKLDEFLPDTEINFVKMDIEGAEQGALIGMKNILMQQRPNLAISAYHKPQDLWTLGHWINELNLGYRFSIRCYGHQCFDTVLYAY
jgi:FkbM family methyltransferase